MRLILHRNVHSDVDAIMEYYERVASQELADDFYAELTKALHAPRRGAAGVVFHPRA